MADQIIVSNNTVQVAVQPTPTVQVEISRAAIGTVSNVPTANYANFAGNVVNAAQPNITSVGTLTNLNVANTVTTNNLVVTGNFQVGNLVANIANYANFAGVAYSVAGANVSGAVANATFATTAGTANTANSATVANSANAVAGANVSGTVANATYALDAGNANFANSATVASSANSVTLANVSGAGNIAAINLDGSTSNVLYGNGVFAPAAGGNTANANYANFAGTAFAVSGANVSGTVANATYAVSAGSATVAASANTVAGANVTGTVANATYAVSAGSATTAGTVTTNAQPNITSVGTLTNLAVTGNVSANAYQLTTSPGTLTAATGQMVWSAAEQTMNLGMNYGVTQQVGLETYILIKASATITDGQVIMFTGANGDNVTGAPANTASVGFRPEYIIGVATQDIANNAFGYVTVFGVVHGLNTNAYNVGDILWVDNATPGALTATRPSDPNFQIEVAAVTKKSGGDGHIQVRVTAFNNIDSLTNVTTTTPSNGQALVYNGNIWVNGNPQQANIANVAYSVSAANVSGLGNIAVINLDGNASNFLDGTGNFVAAPGGANANYANFAGDVVNATQSNITTVGTLTNANVSNTGNIRLGNIIINEASNVTPNVLNQLTVASNVVSNAYRGLAVASGSISDLTGISDATVLAGTLNLTAGAIGNANNRITTTTANITGGGINILGGNSWGGNNTGRNVTSQPVTIQSGTSRSLIASTTTVGNINIIGGQLTFGTATTVGSAGTGGVNISPTTIATESTAANISATTVNIPAASLGFGRFNIVTSNTAITNVTTPLVNFGGAFGLAMAYTNGISNVVIDTFRPLDQVFFRTGGVGHLSGTTGGNVSNISVGNITTAALIFDTGSWIYPNGANVSNVSAGNVTTGDVNIRTGIASNTASVTGTYNRGNIKLNAKNVILEAGITSNTSGTGTFIFDANNTANLGNLVVSNYFSGNGSLLTGITATDANYANFAGNAYSVDGANVIGAVANATFADDSTYASIAYSVDVANVSGIGNIATINLDGSASNVLYGNGTFATAPAGGGETLSPFLLMGG